MRLSLRKNALISLFKEVRVFKVVAQVLHPPVAHTARFDFNFDEVAGLSQLHPSSPPPKGQASKIPLPQRCATEDSTPNITGRRFHRTMEMMPARPS